jgi:hypothetical protein
MTVIIARLPPRSQPRHQRDDVDTERNRAKDRVNHGAPAARAFPVLSRPLIWGSTDVRKPHEMGTPCISTWAKAPSSI